MSRKFRWGILGTAKIARVLIAAIKESDNGEVTAIASRSGDKARQWSKKFGIPLYFDSYQSLLDSHNVDGVYIPLPNSLHARWAARALASGHPVLCEKPIAVNAHEAREIHAAARRTGLYAAEAFMYRFHPAWKEVGKMIRRGDIGEVSTITSRFTFFLDDRSEIPASAELAGGALMDVGCYCVNASRLIAQAQPLRVAAMAKRTNVDDTMVGIMEFPGGLLAHFETGIASFERHGVEITGDLGAIFLPDPWVPCKKDFTIILQKRGRPDRKIKVKGKNTYRLELEEFVNVCRHQAAPSWTFDDSILNMQVLDALALSAQQGKVISL